MKNNSRLKEIIKDLRMLGPLSHGQFAGVGNSAADMIEVTSDLIDALQSLVDAAGPESGIEHGKAVDALAKASMAMKE